MPWTGEGIGKALASGEVAAQLLQVALAADTPEPLAAYQPRLLAEVVPRHAAYRRAQNWLIRPWVANLLAWRATRSPWLHAALAEMLAETTSPDAVFSAGALFRSLWS